MKGKVTIILAVLEAAVLLVMKAIDWKESKTYKPAAGNARRAAGRRVVKPGSPDYNDRPPEGDKNAAYLPASSSTTDEEIHEKE